MRSVECGVKESNEGMGRGGNEDRGGDRERDTPRRGDGVTR